MQENQRPVTVREEPTDTVTTTTAHNETIPDQKVPGTVLGQRIVYYIGGFIIGLLALRFIFALLGASRSSGFVDVVYGFSSIFVSPFYGIFGEPTYGRSQFETSTLVAMFVYLLLTIAIAKLFTMRSANRDLA